MNSDTKNEGEAIVPKFEFVCPFCGRDCMIEEVSLMHEMPMCEDFDRLEPADFLAAVNVAVANKRGVGLT